MGDRVNTMSRLEIDGEIDDLDSLSIVQDFSE